MNCPRCNEPIDDYRTAGEYVEKRIMDIFQEVAVRVADGEFELEHPAPIISASMHMINKWREYISDDRTQA